MALHPKAPHNVSYPGQRDLKQKIVVLMTCRIREWIGGCRKGWKKEGGNPIMKEATKGKKNHLNRGMNSVQTPKLYMWETGGLLKTSTSKSERTSWDFSCGFLQRQFGLRGQPKLSVRIKINTLQRKITEFSLYNVWSQIKYPVLKKKSQKTKHKAIGECYPESKENTVSRNRPPGSTDRQEF